MLGLPKSTEFNRRIPKQKFYENLDISPALRRVFVEKIKTIYWRNKIAPTTVNLEQGEHVNEIEVFEIKLSDHMQPEPVLRQIDKEIPYHILFLIEYEGRYQAWTAYKEASTGINAFKVYSYYHTDWMIENDLPLQLEGLSTDKVYENFVRQIGGESLATGNDDSLQESVKKAIHRKELQKEINTLQAAIRKEKQFKKQVLLNAKLKALKLEMSNENKE